MRCGVTHTRTPVFFIKAKKSRNIWCVLWKHKTSVCQLSGCLRMNLRRTWSISLHHFLLFCSNPLLSLHLSASLFLHSSPHFIYLSCFFIHNFSFSPFLSNLYTLTPPLPLHFPDFYLPVTSHLSINRLCPPFFSSSLSAPLIFALLFRLSSVIPSCFSPFLFSIFLVLFSYCRTALPPTLPFILHPSLSSAPSSSPSLLHSWTDLG